MKAEQYLSAQWEEALFDYVMSQVSPVIDPTMVSYHTELQGEQPVLVLTARGTSTQGASGIYQGQATITYPRIDLSSCLSLPLKVLPDWPMSYHTLRTHLANRYGIYFDEQELCLRTNDGQTSAPLKDTDILENAEIDTEPRIVSLAATTASKRFIPGSDCELLLTSEEGTLSLAPFGNTVAAVSDGLGAGIGLRLDTLDILPTYTSNVA